MPFCNTSVLHSRRKGPIKTSMKEFIPYKVTDFDLQIYYKMTPSSHATYGPQTQAQKSKRAIRKSSDGFSG